MSPVKVWHEVQDFMRNNDDSYSDLCCLPSQQHVISYFNPRDWSTHTPRMQKTKLCKQVSIEKPNQPAPGNEAVFCFDVPIPDVPVTGARIQVTCAGVCYKRRCSVDPGTPPPSPSVQGIRDTSLFPGYEVAGLVNALGPDVPADADLAVGDKVIVFPYDDLPGIDSGYAEYIAVPDIKYLVKIPASVPISVAAMLPSGALWAMNSVQSLIQRMKKFVDANGKCNILIVGTGGLALWIQKIAHHFLATHKDKVQLTVAALKDDNIIVAQEHGRSNIVSWSEDVYESVLIERTKDACKGPVDIVLDFGASPRSVGRTLKCLREGGCILVGSEVFASLTAKYETELKDKNITLEAVEMGSLDQLRELMDLVAEGKVTPPAYKVFPVENAPEVLRRLSKSQLEGRAVLEFNTVN